MTAETAPTPPDEGRSDLDEIVQLPTGFVTVGGIQCRVKRLRTSEFFALMRVLSGGLGAGLGALLGGTPEDFPGRLAGAALVAIPNAELHWQLFLRKVLEPVFPERTDDKSLKAAIDNPEIEETMAIVEAIAVQEADDLVRLGKAMRAWWATNREALTPKRG